MTTEQEAAAGTAGQPHTVTLQLGGEGEPLRIALPPGLMPAEGILPAVQAIADAAIGRAIAATAAKGRPVSCRPGCTACCRQLVFVSDAEARRLAGLVAALPAPRRAAVQARFAAARDAMTKAGLDEPARDPAALPPDGHRALAGGYFRLGIDCPFLDDDRCSIYADRPLICRQALVTTPAAACSDPENSRVAALRLPMLATTLFLLTSDEEPPRPALLPLPFLLDWAETQSTEPPQRGADSWMQRFVQRLARVAT